MRTTSQTWKDIVANGEFDMESVARIYGATGSDSNGVAGSDSRGSYKEYGTITAPIITRSLLSGDALSVGNAIAGQLKFTIMTTDTIPKSAMIVIRARVKKDSSVSEWLEFGTFWLDHRTVTENLTDIEAYDAMKKGNQTYADNSQALVWPKTIKVVIQRIAEQMGVTIDSRTTTDVINADVGDLEIITKPTDDMSLLDILGNIGGILGGNWIITDNNELRFIQLSSPVDINGYLLDHENNTINTNESNKLLWNNDIANGVSDFRNLYVLTDNITPDGTDLGGPIYYRNVEFKYDDINKVYKCENAIAFSNDTCEPIYLALTNNLTEIDSDVGDTIYARILCCEAKNIHTGNLYYSMFLVSAQNINEYKIFTLPNRYTELYNIPIHDIINNQLCVVWSWTMSSIYGAISTELLGFVSNADNVYLNLVPSELQLAYAINYNNSEIVTSINSPEIDVVNIPVIIGNLNMASRYAVSKVVLTKDKDNVFVAGNDGGYEIVYNSNPYASKNMSHLMFGQLSGKIYVPFEAIGCIYDPATEIGDGVAIGTDLSSIIYKETRTLNIGFSADIAAPGRDEMEDEYPFQTFEQKTQYTVDTLKDGIVQNRTSIEQTQERVTIMAEQYTPKDSIRSVFAVDPTNIVLSAGVDSQGHATGKITFNAGTLEVNTSNFTLTPDGIMTCNGANINGALNTEQSNEWGIVKNKIENGYQRYYIGNTLVSETTVKKINAGTREGYIYNSIFRNSCGYSITIGDADSGTDTGLFIDHLYSYDGEECRLQSKGYVFLHGTKYIQMTGSQLDMLCDKFTVGGYDGITETVTLDGKTIEIHKGIITRITTS